MLGLLVVQRAARDDLLTNTCGGDMRPAMLHGRIPNQTLPSFHTHIGEEGHLYG